MALFNIFSREKKENLYKGLSKTKENVFTKLSKAIVGKSKVDEDVLDELEEILISSDVGTETSFRIIERVEKRVKKDKYLNSNALYYDADWNEVVLNQIKIEKILAIPSLIIAPFNP